MQIRYGSFNGATAVRPWMAACRRSTTGAPPSFNGATAVRPWMAVADGRRIVKMWASMGPRP